MFNVFKLRRPVETDNTVVEPETEGTPTGPAGRGEQIETSFDRLCDGLSQLSLVQAMTIAVRRDIDELVQSQRRLQLDNTRLSSSTASLTAALEQAHASRKDVERRNGELEAQVPTLREELRAAEAVRNEFQNQIVVAQTEARIVGQRAAELEAQKAALEAALAERSQDLEQTNRELTQVAARLFDGEKQLAGTQTELGTLRQEAELLRALSGRNATELAQRERTISELRADRDRLEASLSQSQDELNRTIQAFEGERAALEERAEALSEAQRSLEAKLFGAQSRADTLNRLLADVREQLEKRTVEAREAAAEIREIGTARHRAEAQLASTSKALEDTKASHTAVEEARKALLERAEGLARALSAREGTVRRLEDAEAALKDRLARLQDAFDARATEWATKERELLAQVESEQMDRALAEGALEGARKEKLRLQNELGELRRSISAASFSGDKPDIRRSADVISLAGEGAPR